jgi:thiamine-phosphate pyrophosphorylase
VIDVWLGAGVRLVQLRAKQMEGGPLLELARELRARTQASGARLIVNDRADIARLARADGVHVGQDDLPPADVRAIVGADRIIGFSTHNDEQIESACAASISYLAIGPVFATRTKTNAGDAPVGLAGVRRASDRAAAAGLPVVAIGGITLENAPDVMAAGASSIAVITDLLVGDPGDRCRAYLRMLQ